MSIKGIVKQSDLYCFQKRNYFKWRTAIVPKRMYAVVTYWLRYRKFLDVKHPKTFDEKLWWLKLHYHNPLQTQCADKWKVRDYVRDCGLEEILIESFGRYDSVDDIDLNKIPADEFFLKCNHLSGGNAICRKNSYDRSFLRRQFGHWLKDNAYYYGFEWPYKYMKPCLVTERILHTGDPNGLLDYKFMCFEGDPKLLFLDIGVCETDGTHAEEYYRNIYDMDFNLLPITETRENKKDSGIVKPKNFDFMIKCARRLSAPFPHCRVDLYNIDGMVYFGEITFYHGSAYNDIKPVDADLMMGSWIDIEQHHNVMIEKSVTTPYEYQRISLDKAD